MAGFGQIYSENYKQKAVPNDVKLGQKERTCKAGPEESVVAEDWH